MKTTRRRCNTTWACRTAATTAPADFRVDHSKDQVIHRGKLLKRLAIEPALDIKAIRNAVLTLGSPILEAAAAPAAAPIFQVSVKVGGEASGAHVPVPHTWAAPCGRAGLRGEVLGGVAGVDATGAGPPEVGQAQLGGRLRQVLRGL